MASFTSYFKKAPAFFLAVLLVCCVEAFLHTMPNLYYHHAGGAFLTTYKRKVAEDSQKTYDILMYGDSRSLSILGHAKSKKQKYSLYNFSLPAAGLRYFKFFFQKYQKHHKNPKAIIWAVDPEQYIVGKNKAFDTDPRLWQQYKHRLLNLFTLQESWQQYKGRELVFIAKEYIPRYILSYKYRKEFKSFVNGFKAKNFYALFEKLTPLDPNANFRDYKYLVDKMPNRLRNLRIEQIIQHNYGQINLGDYFKANLLFAKLTEGARQKAWEDMRSKMNHTSIHNTEILKEFIQYCKQEKIALILLNLPRAAGFNDTKYFRAVVPALRGLAAKHTHVSYIQFPDMDYPLELFGEAIHFSPKGSDRLNQEFQESVYPEIIRFLDKEEL
ncbi:MAG: DUF1574 family protein [Spirochaetota bacterium]